MFEVYPLLRYLHVLLFVYWLGADLGVFMISRYVGRADLSLNERRRFLEVLLALDMAPRTALVLVIPTGLGLAVLGNWLAVPPGVALILVLFTLTWLVLVWALHRRPRASNLWRTVDHTIRCSVVGSTFIFGISNLLGVNLYDVIPTAPRWFAAKIIAYGGAVLCGLLLRRVLVEWARGFEELVDSSTAEQGNLRITAAMPRSAFYAFVLWGCVLLAAFCGVVKPG